MHNILLEISLSFYFLSPGRKRDFSPVSWSQYFESMEDVEVENETGKDISFAKWIILLMFFKLEDLCSC